MNFRKINQCRSTTSRFILPIVTDLEFHFLTTY